MKLRGSKLRGSNVKADGPSKRKIQVEKQEAESSRSKERKEPQGIAEAGPSGSVGVFYFTGSLGFWGTVEDNRTTGKVCEKRSCLVRG
ncbi:hypothetical protein ACHWQZ_G018716 [Mnemiopsis leidyi]